MNLNDVLQSAIGDYNAELEQGGNPRHFDTPAHTALTRLHRLAETQGLVAPPRRGLPVQVIYPYHGGRAGTFGRVNHVFPEGGRTTRLIARVTVGHNLSGQPLVQDFPLWCLRAATEGEMAAAERAAAAPAPMEVSHV